MVAKDFAQLLQELETPQIHGGQLQKMEQDKVTAPSVTLDPLLAKIRQRHAECTYQGDEDRVSTAFVRRVAPEEILAYRREGVQQRVLYKLKHGEYRECDFIDLHGRKLEQAFALTMDFIRYARAQGFRCVLIIHGKGERLKDKALLKSHVAHWLRQLPEVLAYHSAPPFKGGAGALLVFLKKDEKASAENFERHAKRRP